MYIQYRTTGFKLPIMSLLLKPNHAPALFQFSHLSCFFINYVVFQEPGIEFDRGDDWMLYDDKRADSTDEFVPNADDDSDAESSSSDEAEEMEKRKLGDSLRLGKRSDLMDGDGVQKFGRHARLFEQMRLGKRSRSEDEKPRDKKKSNGKRLQLVRFGFTNSSNYASK